MITYELLIEKLTAEEYKKLLIDLEPLKQFVNEWLIPFDIECNITVKWHNQHPITGPKLVLDYNSELITG